MTHPIPVFFIGGGKDASNYKNFKEYLELQEYHPFAPRETNWKDALQANLGEAYHVIFLPMPNRYFASYRYWKIVFEKHIPYIVPKSIFIGYSLWASFLIKYLSKSIHVFDLSQIHLVAPALFDSASEKLWSFTIPKYFYKTYKKYESITYLYASKDDPIVPFSDATYFASMLPNCKTYFFEDKGHFYKEPCFPELENNIFKSIDKM